MATTIVMAGITLQTPGRPNPLPTPKRIARLKFYQMRRGLLAGLRCMRRLGSHVSQTDFRFRLSAMTPSHVATFATLHHNQETFGLVIGSTTYTVLFAEQGFDADLYRWLDYDGYYAAPVHVHVLSQG